MPSKKKRVASRQAQLSQRKRRERNRDRRADPAPGPAVRPQAMPADPTADPPTDPGVQHVASDADDVVAPAPVSEPAAATPAVRQPALPRQQARPRRRGAAARLEPVPTYPYLGREVRHIGIVTSIIVVLLTVLTVLLR